jgi:hypothetical protein
MLPYSSRIHVICNPAGFTLLPSSGTVATHRLVSTNSFALAGIIGGIAIGIWAVWLLVVRIRKLKLKANVASAGTSETSPLLVRYQAPTDLQVGARCHFRVPNTVH